MKLPRIDHPIYKTTAPSGKDIRFRPLVVREEKMLLMINETEEFDVDFYADTILNIIGNCTFNDIDVNEMASFDVEWLFCKIRAKSVGEIIRTKIYDDIDDKSYVVEVDLEKIEIDNIDSVKPKKILLSDNIGIVIHQPTFKQLLNFRYNVIFKFLQEKLDKEDMLSETFLLFANCVSSVFNNETVFVPGDYANKDEFVQEVKEFLESAPIDKFKLLDEYINNCPSIFYKTSYTTSTGEKSVELKGLRSFFTY